MNDKPMLLDDVVELERENGDLRDDLAEANRVNALLRSLLQEFIDDVNGNANELSSLATNAERQLNRL